MRGAKKPTDRPDRPLVVTPMVLETKRFHSNGVQGRKAVILTKDGCVRTFLIDRSGRVFGDGKDLMGPHHPVWEGHPPVIAWSDL